MGVPEARWFKLRSDKQRFRERVQLLPFNATHTRAVMHLAGASLQQL